MLALPAPVRARLLALPAPRRVLALPYPAPRFKVDRKSLLALLRTIPGKASVALRADQPENDLSLSWDDGAVIQRRNLPTWQRKVYAPFHAQLNASALQQVAGKTDPDYLSMGFDGASLGVTSCSSSGLVGRWRFKPVRPDVRAEKRVAALPAVPAEGWHFDAGAFLEAFKTVKGWVSKDGQTSDRIHFELESGRVRLVGTDGCRLLVSEVETIGAAPELVRTCNLDSDAFSAVAKFCKQLAKESRFAVVRVAVSGEPEDAERWIFVSTADGAESIAVADRSEKYPDWRRALPETSEEQSVLVDVKSTLKALKDLEAFKSKRNRFRSATEDLASPVIVAEAIGSTLRLRSNWGAELIREVALWGAPGPELTVALDVHYLRAMLAVFSDVEMVRWFFPAEGGPYVMRDGARTALLMPIAGLPDWALPAELESLEAEEIDSEEPAALPAPEVEQPSEIPPVLEDSAPLELPAYSSEVSIEYTVETIPALATPELEHTRPLERTAAVGTWEQFGYYRPSAPAAPIVSPFVYDPVSRTMRRRVG